MLCIKMGQPDLPADLLEMIERGSTFPEGDGLDGYREQFTVPPDGKRPAIPYFMPDFEGIEVILDREEMPAFPAGIDDLIGLV
jgi:hypothetical protein